jgi:hypothetical protein
MFVASTIAANVVNILVGLGGPMAEAANSWRVRRKVRKIIKRVTVSLLDGHPEVAGAMAASEAEIARALARLADAGRPLATRNLAERWAAAGLDYADAGLYAQEYVDRLHDELLKIAGFRAVILAGSSVETAERMQDVAEALRLNRAGGPGSGRAGGGGGVLRGS